MMMDCESCQPNLLELAYGELDPDASSQLREHLEGCDSCRASLEKLREGVQLGAQFAMLEPPEELSQRVMAVAEAEARHAGAQVAPSVRPTLWQRWLDFFGTFAMARQVGMATVTLLIVAVGLWSVPELRRSPEAAGSVVVSPDPEGEAGPSLQPAERLDLAMDRRGRRLRPRGEAGQAPASAAVPQVEPVLAEPAADETLAEAAEDEMLAVVEQDLDAPGAESGKDVAAASAPNVEPGDSARAFGEAPRAKAKAPGGGSGRGFSAGGPAATGQFAPPPPAAASPLDQAPEARQVTRSPAKKAAKRSQAPPGRARAVASAPPRADAMDDGLPAGNVGGASAKGEADRHGSADDAALAQARAKRGASGCRAALPLYERLVSRSPKSAAAGHAMLDLADCYRQLGQAALAASTLKRALANPTSRARAKRVLESAQPRPASKAAAGP